MRKALLALWPLFATGAVSAAELPCSQVRMVVPYPAGGATDVAARLVAERLEGGLKKPVVIENRAGASGNIGTALVVAAPADGCTLLVNAAVIATFPASFARLPYDPIKDLAPVAGIGITPTLLVTAADNPPTDVASLVAWSRAKPGGINFATAGYGLLQHLAVEELAQRSGGSFTHVAYKGGAQAVTDLVTARLDLGSFSAGSVLPLVRDGKLKAFAVVADKRTDLLPEVRTSNEQGMVGLDAGVHFMIYAPAATPRPVVTLLSDEIRKVVGDPALKPRFASIGFDPTPIGADECAAVMKRTAEQWVPVVKRLSIKLD